MESRLTAAIIGCGRMGAFTSTLIRRHAPSCWFPLSHADALLAHPRLELSAICDRNPAALAQAAKAYNCAGTYTDAHRMLEVVRPALVGIATRTVGRANLIHATIEHGTKALHVEKPLCSSTREWSGLMVALQALDIFVTYGAIRRHLAPYRLARELADSGRYGPLREIRVNVGSAALCWSHPHSVDLILFAAGERRIVGVQAKLAGVEFGTVRSEIRSDPRVIAASIHFEDGVAGHITQAIGSDFVLSCAEGEIIVRADGHLAEIYFTPPDTIYPTAHRLDEMQYTSGPTGTLAPISQLVSCLDGDSAAIASNAAVKRDLLRGQQALFAMAQSHLMESRIVDPQELDSALIIHAYTGGQHA